MSAFVIMHYYIAVNLVLKDKVVYLLLKTVSFDWSWNAVLKYYYRYWVWSLYNWGFEQGRHSSPCHSESTLHHWEGSKWACDWNAWSQMSGQCETYSEVCATRYWWCTVYTWDEVWLHEKRQKRTSVSNGRWGQCKCMYFAIKTNFHVYFHGCTWKKVTYILSNFDVSTF